MNQRILVYSVICYRNSEIIENIEAGLNSFREGLAGLEKAG